MPDLRKQYIAEWQECDTPGYRFELTRRELAWAGVGWLVTLTRVQAAETVARLHIGMADRAEQDRIESPELVDSVFGQRLARLEITIATPIERRELQRNIFRPGDRL